MKNAVTGQEKATGFKKPLIVSTSVQYSNLKSRVTLFYIKTMILIESLNVVLKSLLQRLMLKSLCLFLFASNIMFCI